jgi:deoxyadenosine/deoxycytidine kinase
LLYAKNNLNEEEFRLFQRLFSVLNNSFPKPDLLLYLHRPIEVVLDQIRRRGRSMEQNISGDYLEEIQDAYMDFFKTEQDTPVVVLQLGKADYLHDTGALEAIVHCAARAFKPGLQVEKL